MRFFYDDRIGKVYLGRIITTAVVSILAATVACSTFSIIPTGYTGVKTTFGQVSNQPLSAGFYFKIPFAQSIQKVNNLGYLTTRIITARLKR